MKRILFAWGAYVIVARCCGLGWLDAFTFGTVALGVVIALARRVVR